MVRFYLIGRRLGIPAHMRLCAENGSKTTAVPEVAPPIGSFQLADRPRLARKLHAFTGPDSIQIHMSFRHMDGRFAEAQRVESSTLLAPNIKPGLLKRPRES